VRAVSAPGRLARRRDRACAVVARRPLGVRSGSLLPGLPDLGRLIDRVGAQQNIDEPHELASGKDERPLMRVFGGLRSLGLVVGSAVSIGRRNNSG
jgi:hypothetical protein